MTLEPTIADVLDAMQAFSTHMEEELLEIKTKMATKEDLEKLRMETREELKRMATKDDLARLRKQMVTKDYLDDKLARLHSDIVLQLRREFRGTA
jgi:hypothetical protein